MKAKRILGIAGAVLAFGLSAFAQTADEILEKMEKAMEGRDDLEMIVEMKIPVLGTFATKTYTRGDKSRMELEAKGHTATTWTDGTTSWTYTAVDNTLEIDNVKAGDSENDAEMLNDVAEGYDVSIESETASYWRLLCKKSKSNKNKDDPKKMTIEVYKNTYMPKSLTATVSGVTLTLRDFKLGVTEEMVTFRIEDFPNAKIVDKRK